MTIIHPLLKTTNLAKHANWISADVQGHIKPLPIPIVKVEIEEELLINIIKVKICINPTSVMSETYNINMFIFKDVQPEEFLALLKNYRIAIYGTVTTSPFGTNHYLRTMIILGGYKII